MLSPLIRRPRRKLAPCSKESGFTMALVALALTATIAMAALSIDIGTLYEAKAEAQRAADAAALTAAQVISLSGITGDPTNGATDGSWEDICGGASPPSTLAATNVAQQNLISGVAAPTVTVNYGAGKAGGAAADCSTLGADFGVNPTVTVTVTSATLPLFFSRAFSLIPGVNYSGTTVSATATAEAFNPSNSGSVAGSVIPVQPRCVKPLIIPNVDPTTGNAFIDLTSGAINNAGISPNGVIGENFIMAADCLHGQTNCEGSNMLAYPPASSGGSGGTIHYLPALVQGTPGAVPSCATADNFQEAVAGCDQTTVYTCGIPSGTNGATQVDLTENPVNPHSATGDTGTAVQCLIHSTAEGLGNGQDQLNAGRFPFQIQAGSDNPLVKQGLVSDKDNITTSSSIVTIPVFDQTQPLGSGTQPPVTIVGFLQVFIQDLTGNGYLNVYVLNVAGCGNGSSTSSSNPITGTSPVPVRLITPP